jgi:hypothetical protein
MEGFAGCLEKLNRYNLLTLKKFTEVVKSRHQIPHGLYNIGFKITSACDSFIGMKINQYKRPIFNSGNSCDNGAFQFEHNRSRYDLSEGERLKSHGYLISFLAKFSTYSIEGFPTYYKNNILI